MACLVLLFLFFINLFPSNATNQIIGGLWNCGANWFILQQNGTFTFSSSLFISTSCWSMKTINGEYYIDNTNTFLYLNTINNINNNEAVVLYIQYNNSGEINSLTQLNVPQYQGGYLNPIACTFTESHSPSIGIMYLYNGTSIFTILDDSRLIYFNGTTTYFSCYSSYNGYAFESGNNNTYVINYKSYIDDNNITHMHIFDNNFIECDYLIIGNYIIEICNKNNYMIISPFFN